MAFCGECNLEAAPRNLLCPPCSIGSTSPVSDFIRNLSTPYLHINVNAIILLLYLLLFLFSLHLNQAPASFSMERFGFRFSSLKEMLPFNAESHAHPSVSWDTFYALTISSPVAFMIAGAVVAISMAILLVAYWFDERRETPSEATNVRIPAAGQGEGANGLRTGVQKGRNPSLSVPPSPSLFSRSLLRPLRRLLLPLTFRALNATSRALESLPVIGPAWRNLIRRLLPLDEASVLGTASAATGLSDFGDEGFLVPLRLLLAGLEGEARLSLTGRMLAVVEVQVGGQTC